MNNKIGLPIKIGDKVRIEGLKTSAGIVKGIEVVVFPARWWKRLLGQKQEWKTIFHLEENKDQYSTHITGVGKNNITIKGL